MSSRHIGRHSDTVVITSWFRIKPSWESPTRLDLLTLQSYMSLGKSRSENST
jgi:hypothetical protein